MKIIMRIGIVIVIIAIIASSSGIWSDAKDKNDTITVEEQNTLDSQKTESITEANLMRTISLTINDYVLTAELADNSSALALMELLQDGPLTINMRDYENMEKVGSLETSLPTNNEQITTEAGDLILYMGNAFVIYYAPNSWNFTRLGRIQNITADELKNILGDGDVTVVLSAIK